MGGASWCGYVTLKLGCALSFFDFGGGVNFTVALKNKSA
jgi:hypothetical protein